MRSAAFDADAIRVFLHVLAISVWVGGQVVVGGIVPLVRRGHPEALGIIAAGFGKIAWPAFGVAVATGIWSMLAVTETTTGWSAVLGIKMLLVVIAGAMAWLHQTTSQPALRGATAGLGLVVSLVVMFLGVMLSG